MQKLIIALSVLGGMLVQDSAMASEIRDRLVGSITSVKGDVFVLRDGRLFSAEKGVRLLKADVIRTEKKSGVGIVLRDDTTLSLGPSSEVKMSEFQFEPDEGIVGMTISVVKGTMAFISGQIAKIAPGSATIETPAGVAAVRGTELLVEVRETRESREGNMADE